MCTIFFSFAFIMNELVLYERITAGKDWATLLFTICAIVIAVNKTYSWAQFNDFSKLIFSDKYLKIYKDNSNLLSAFTISMFFVQIVSFSFFVLLFLDNFQIVSKTSFTAFVQVFTFLLVFILSKFLIDKIIADIFEIEELIEQFNLVKVNYRAYLGFLLLPFTLVLFYNNINNNYIYIALLILIVFISLITYILSIKNYQFLLQRYIFYFILYLCTLEIAPYYFMYYWFTKH